MVGTLEIPGDLSNRFGEFELGISTFPGVFKARCKRENFGGEASMPLRVPTGMLMVRWMVETVGPTSKLTWTSLAQTLAQHRVDFTSLTQSSWSKAKPRGSRPRLHPPAMELKLQLTRKRAKGTSPRKNPC